MDDFKGKIPQRRPGRRPGPAAAPDAHPASDPDPETWVDLQLQQALRRGILDELPPAGEPLEGLTPEAGHDPEWWVRRMTKRERITGVLPPAITLRIEDARLDEAIDRESGEAGVRQIIDEFNRRVCTARRSLKGGPPVITPTRDPDREVERWRERRQPS